MPVSEIIKFGLLLGIFVLLLLNFMKKTEQRESLKEDMAQLRREQADNIDRFREEQSNNLDRLGRNLDDRLGALQKTNDEKLAEVNRTVGERLQKNFADSFGLVNKRLEEVNKTVGEISGLTGDVKDLRKLFSGVKTRGMWGETQLRAIIEQLLTREQYAENVATKPKSSERVEFAVKMPGYEDTPVLIPVDSKCPVEDYARIVEAMQNGDTAAAEAARKALKTRVLAEAKDIHSKYIEVPYTTDFGILFAPIEGLFAEIMSIDGLAEEMHSKYSVIAAGPTTFAALLNSLRLGFRTLQIQKRAGEIEILLGKAKTEFEKYGAVVEKSLGHLEKAMDTIGDLSVRTKKINAALKNVEAVSTLPEDFSDGE